MAVLEKQHLLETTPAMNEIPETFPAARASGTTIYGRLFREEDIAGLSAAARSVLTPLLTGQMLAISHLDDLSVYELSTAAGRTLRVEGTVLAAASGGMVFSNAGTMTLGADYPSGSGTVYHDALVAFDTVEGIRLDNTGTLDVNGAIRNFGPGGITVISTGETARLNLHGDLEQHNSGTISVTGYTLIAGNVTGKTVFLSGSGTLRGNLSGGGIAAGETTRLQIDGGIIGEAGNSVCGVSGSIAAGATEIVISGSTTVNSKIYGGGADVRVNGQSEVTIGGNGSTVQLNDSVYGGGYGANAAVDRVLMTFNAGTTAATRIIGGGFNAQVGTGTGTAVAITVNGGNYQAIYGGGFNDGTGNADIFGDTRLVFNNGTHTGLFGGGYNANVNGNTAVIIGDGGPAAISFGYGIFGGGFGNADITGTANFTINSNVTIIKNAYAGGYILSGQTQTIGATQATLSGGTINGLLFGGSMSISGTATIGNANTLINSGTFNGGLYGGGVAGGTGSMNITTATTVINSGTFTQRVYGGSTAIDTGNSSVTTANLTITGGTFNGDIIGGSNAQGGTTSTGTVNMTINGGDFHGDVLGGGRGSTNANSLKSTVETVAITIDMTQNAIDFHNRVIYCGGDLASTVSGNVSLTIKGGAASNALNNLAKVTGDGWTAGSVKGNSTLVFDDYKNNFGALITAFDTVRLTNNAQVSLTGGQNLTAVNKWEVAADSTPTTALLDFGNAANNFLNDTLAVDVSGWDTATGTVRTLMQGSAAAFSGWGESMSVTIGGTAAVWDADLNGWQSQDNTWLVSVEPIENTENAMMKLAKIA